VKAVVDVGVFRHWAKLQARVPSCSLSGWLEVLGQQGLEDYGPLPVCLQGNV